MNTPTICCIFNQAAHYREPIYRLLDEKLKCDFYFTTWKVNPFRQMKYVELKGFRKSFKNLKIAGNFYWQNGMLFQAFKPYNHYILTGEPYSITTWIMLILIKILGKKTYLWTHGWYGDETPVKVKVKKYFFSLSSEVLLYGNYALNLMIKEGISLQKLTCIYNSLDYEKQLQIRKNISSSHIYHDYFKNNLPVLIYIGRIQKIKKIELIIDALFLLKKKGNACNLVIIGKESEDSNINELIESYKLIENIWLYGSCYDENMISQLIYNADVCVSPGNVGLTAMHSLVYGTPVISHNNFAKQMPEFEAIEKGLTGDFFEEDSLIDLCNKIQTWILLPLEQRELVRSRCYKIIDEKYNPQNQLKEITNVIERHSKL